jgi:hypothetical protein
LAKDTRIIGAEGYSSTGKGYRNKGREQIQKQCQRRDTGARDWERYSCTERSKGTNCIVILGK